MEDKIILTKSELQEMLNTAVNLGKIKAPVKSSLFNPNLLFQEEGRQLKESVEEFQIMSGRVTHERWGDIPEIREADVHDQIRKLVLMAFFAKYNTEVPINSRLNAKKLYSKISQLFLEEFQESCKDFKVR